jgi:predicted dehydrogenase
MSDRRLIVVDPGHFHAALVQKQNYPQLSPAAHVYAPLGPDLVDYLARIARFNARPEQPTQWRLEVHAGPDFLDRMRREPAGGIAVIAGRNRGKIEKIAAAVEAGLHVIADKPVIIRREDLPRLEAVLEAAEAKGLVVLDMMAGRHDAIARLIQWLRGDAEVFGEPVSGTPDQPGVRLANTHQLLKTVAGVPNPRPSWYFDIAEQGEGLADTGTHLVDRAHETLFPGEPLEYRRDIRFDAASRWPTPVSLAQFQQLTAEARWPDYLAPWVTGDVLEYFCNGRLDYRIRGIHVRLEVRWEWQTEAGDDTHSAIYRGSRARLERRQGAAEGYRPELYVVPEAEITAALERRIAALRPEFPGIGLDREAGVWRVVVPDALRIGHDAHFAQFARHFLGYVGDLSLLPAREKANLLAKYHVTTEGVGLSHH